MSKRIDLRLRLWYARHILNPIFGDSAREQYVLKMMENEIERLRVIQHG